MSRRLRPLADREAILALGLAGAGCFSLGVTFPAAGLLAVRFFRTARPSDGTGPAFTVLVFAVAWVSFLLGYPLLRALWLTAVDEPDPRRLAGFLAGWMLLAAAVLVLATFLCRCHPERSAARSVARAGMVTVIATALLQAATMTGAMVRTGGCGSSIADCVGSTPWSSAGAAVAIGGVWLALSLLFGATGRRARTLVGRMART